MPSTPAPKRSQLTFGTGSTMFGGAGTLLEWTADDRLVLHAGATPDTAVTFETPVSEIASIGGAMTSLIVKLKNGSSTRIWFWDRSKAVDGAIQVNTGGYTKQVVASHIQDWIDAFRAVPVKITWFGPSGMYGRAAIVVGVIVVVVVIYAVWKVYG
ncbi:MAG TPA: hypothetical protein VGM70_04355 [Pseudolysinimonas sp.]|jgi:hypothetical protein